MDDPAEAIVQNIPEMLAWDLAEQEDVFLARGITAGSPAVGIASEAQPPNVPRCNPSRVATRWLHHTAPETVLWSLEQNNMDTAWEYEREAFPKGGVSPRAWFRAKGQVHTSGAEYFDMKQENDKDEKELFLDGHNEDWRSDSSVDVEAGISSPSVWTQQRSITTAATSVDTHFVSDGRGAGGCVSVAGSLEKQAARVAEVENESWVDLEPEMLNAEEDESREIGSPRACEELDQGCRTQLAVFGMDGVALKQNQQPLLSVPRRRSSLSHQVTTVVLGETAHSRKTSTHISTEQLASQLPLPLSRGSSHYFRTDQPFQQDWDESEAESASVVATGRCQARQNLQLEPSEAPAFDQLSLPPLSVEEATHRDAPARPGSQQQHPYLVSKPHKSQSVTRMPLLTSVHSWLESSGGSQPRSPILTPTSPVSLSPITNIRVSTEVLNILRTNVANFPDTMLRTSTFSVETIRSYSRKLRRGDFTIERVPADDMSIVAESPTSPKVSHSLRRKASLGNLNLLSSLRGKFATRFGHSATSPTLREDSEDSWPPVDRCNTPPSRPSDARAEACVNALRCIFPQGTDFLLDALYAHIIVYNYINSLCGGLPHLHQNGAAPHLRTRLSENFVLPPGVTSLADLQCQEDSHLVRDFHDVAASMASRSIVSTKAAAMLGLGSTNMGKPVKPRPGTLGSREARLRNTTPPAARFVHSLESESAMRNLRDDIGHNIYRLVETVKTCSSPEGKGSDEEECGIIVGPNGRELDPVVMRLMCELVRCYEELNG